MVSPPSISFFSTLSVCNLICFFLAVQSSLNAQPLPNAEETLSIQSRSFSLSVPEQPDLKGGHLQGIQLFNGTLLISGSSEQFGYLCVFQKLGNDFHYLGLKPLAQGPLNHAGGFQLAENWLAIGLEDPKSKRRSVIQLIDVSSFKTVSAPPVYSLEREGDVKMSTAGAVALLKRKDHFLLAVGTWDCTTIDFYRSNGIDPYSEGFDFQLWTHWDSREAIRKDWKSKDFGSYQSLQLTEDSTGIYLTGFGRTKNGTDLADVFLLHSDLDPYHLMQKTASYSVQAKGGVSFRNGAGFTIFDGVPSIIAVGHKLSPRTELQIFPIHFK
jgi:hypothetical protein